MLSYLKLPGCKVGLLINSNVKVLKDGIRRVVDGFPDPLRPALSAVLSLRRVLCEPSA